MPETCSTSAAQDILDTILSRLNGATYEAVSLELRNTIREFLRETSCWRDILTVPIIKDRREYVLDPYDQNAKINIVHRITVGTRELQSGGGRKPIPFRDEDHGTPIGYVIDPDGTSVVLDVVPDNNGDDPMIITVSLTTRPGINAVPEFVATRYFEGLVSGVLYRMMSQPKKPYTDQNLALFHTKKYSSQMAVARDEANRFYTTGPGPWKFPYFARGRHYHRSF
jgi:hypothetical protein